MIVRRFCLGQNRTRVRRVFFEGKEFSSRNFATRCHSQPVNTARHPRRAKPIINVHHGHIRRTTIQHPQQSRHSAKAGAVTHAGRHRNHWNSHQSSHHARQRAFHSSHTNNHTCA